MKTMSQQFIILIHSKHIITSQDLSIHLFGHIPTVKPYCSYPELRNQMKTQFRISGTQNTHLMFNPIISNHSQSHNPIQMKCVENDNSQLFDHLTLPSD